MINFFSICANFIKTEKISNLSILDQGHGYCDIGILTQLKQAEVSKGVMSKYMFYNKINDSTW